MFLLAFIIAVVALCVVAAVKGVDSRHIDGRNL
jgi:hypothetical protein